MKVIINSNIKLKSVMYSVNEDDSDIAHENPNKVLRKQLSENLMDQKNKIVKDDVSHVLSTTQESETIEVMNVPPPK